MGKTVRYTAGLMIAAGAALAFSAPAAAAPATPPPGSDITWAQNFAGFKFNPQSNQQAQITSTNLNNFGNPQVGFKNHNGGGTLNSTNAISQVSNQNFTNTVSGWGY